MKSSLTKKQLGKRYRNLRESIETINLKTCTQDSLAKDLGITKTQISNLETGKKYISITELISYAKYFNVTMEYLLGISNNKYYDTYNIGKTLGLSDKSIKNLHYYNTNNNQKDYNYIQVINFLIESINSNKLERIDRFLFTQPNSFLIRDENKNEYINSHYVTICNEFGDYEINVKDIQKFLFLDMQELLFNLQKEAVKIKRDKKIKYIETKDLNNI